MFNMTKGGKPSHIFLTGKKQVGKTTLINKVLKSLDEPFCGLRSVCVCHPENNSKDVYIVPADCKNPILSKDNLVGTCKDSKVIRSYPEVFNTLGVSLLSPKPNCRIMVIDEIGILEENAELYKKTLSELLDRTDINILGVFRNPVLKKHPNIKSFVVTEANRENLFSVTVRLLTFRHI